MSNYVNVKKKKHNKTPYESPERSEKKMADLQEEYKSFLSFRQKVSERLNEINLRNQLFKLNYSVYDRIKDSNIIQYTDFFHFGLKCDQDVEIFKIADDLFGEGTKWPHALYTKSILECVKMDLAIEVEIGEIETRIEEAEISNVVAKKRRVSFGRTFGLTKDIIIRIGSLQRWLINLGTIAIRNNSEPRINQTTPTVTTTTTISPSILFVKD